MTVVIRADVTLGSAKRTSSANRPDEANDARFPRPEYTPCDTAAREFDDASLLQLVGANNDYALRQLYSRYSKLVYALAFRLLRNQTQAEEALQETFIRVWRAAVTYDPARGAVDTWITTIARNRALSMLRKQRETSLFEAVEWVATEDDEQSDPEIVAWMHARRDMVRKALDELPWNQRVTIMLAYYQGLTHLEIAACTGVPLGTVKSRLRLALGRLGALLAPALNRARDESA